MQIARATSAASWNHWLDAHGGPSSFLQSWEWGQLLTSEGKNIERLLLTEGDETVAQALLVFEKLPFGWQYAFCPKGPIMKYRMSNVECRTADDALTAYLKRKGIIFFRFEPSQLTTNYKLQITRDTNPRATTLLDLAKSEDELLAAMHEKTRYNIRLAERKGLQISDAKNFDVFWKLSQTTAQRDGFRLHPAKHYQTILQSPVSYQLSVELEVRNLELVTRNSRFETLATGIFIGFGKTFTYLYGASDHSQRQLMAPYLIQWEAIKLAKRLGYAQYDFFGIAPPLLSPPKADPPREDKEGSRARASGGGLSRHSGIPLAAGPSPASTNSVTLGSPNVRQAPPSLPLERGGSERYDYDPKHRYAGVTRFKLGFWGTTYEEPGTFDLPISPVKYKMYRLLRTVRRLI